MVWLQIKFWYVSTYVDSNDFGGTSRNVGTPHVIPAPCRRHANLATRPSPTRPVVAATQISRDGGGSASQTITACICAIGSASDGDAVL